jgi:hypothetical protein
MMEAARSSETLVNFYHTTWRYNPEDSHLPNVNRILGIICGIRGSVICGFITGTIAVYVTETLII